MDDLIERAPLLEKMFPCFEKKLVREAPAVNRWIPCSERLPEKDVSVLIYAAGHRVTAYFDAVKGVFRLTESDGLFYRTSAVTHWMPLPEPPKVGGDAE